MGAVAKKYKQKRDNRRSTVVGGCLGVCVYNIAVRLTILGLLLGALLPLHLGLDLPKCFKAGVSTVTSSNCKTIINRVVNLHFIFLNGNLLTISIDSILN